MNHASKPNLHSLFNPCCTCGRKNASPQSSSSSSSSSSPSSPELTSQEQDLLNHTQDCAINRVKREEINEWNEWETLVDIKVGGERLFFVVCSFCFFGILFYSFCFCFVFVLLGRRRNFHGLSNRFTRHPLL